MVLVIAEIGVNWDGDFLLLEKMVKKSKESGFDAIKLQSFNEDMIKNNPIKKRLFKSSVSASNIKKISDIMKKVEIEWFCTPMFEDAVQLLDPYVNRFKIRELDARDLENKDSLKILDLVLKTDKEIIISSQTLPRKSKYYKNNKIKWLYCIPKYPCQLDEYDFIKMEEFHGLSNHCLDKEAILSAVKHNATIIEMHVTYNKNNDYIDNNVSFDFIECENIIKDIRKIVDTN